MDTLTLDTARNLLLARVEQKKEIEKIDLWDAGRRVLAEDIWAERNQPPFPRSPLDGYALRSQDIQGASHNNPVKLKVIDEVMAGFVSKKTVTEGTAIRIMTGAPIPEGADCVIRQEDTDYGEEIVSVYKEVSHHENYCFEGEDYKKGTILLKKGTELTAVEIGVLASAGVREILVCKKVSVALITTGDETVLPGEELRPGKIYDSNLYSLGVQLSLWNVDVVFREKSGDNVREAAEFVRRAAECADLIITTGGVSVGKADIMHEVLKYLGCERIFWKIAMKPGMPTLCAEYQGKLLVCLSGNPYGAVVNLELLVRPLLAKMTGRESMQLKKKQGMLQNSYLKKSRVTRYVRGYFEDGQVRLTDGSNASGVLSSMCGCNCLVEIPAGSESVREGETVWVILLQSVV